MTRKVHALPEDELARLAGVSETTWKAHKKDGAPVPRTQGDINAWLTKYHVWRKAHGKVPSTEFAAAADPETVKHKREYAKLRVVLARIEVGERMGSLVPRQEVVAAIGRASLAVRMRLNAMVRKMAARLGPLCGPGGASCVEEELQAEVDAICDAFAQGVAHANDVGTASAPGTGSADPGQLATAESDDGERVGRSPPSP